MTMKKTPDLIDAEDNVPSLSHPLLKKELMQGNHEHFIIPPEVAMHAHEPLYFLIALWCQIQRRWINRNEIATAFHLTERRASYQLTYINRKKTRIVSMTRKRKSENERTLRVELWVESVIIPERREYNPNKNQSEEKEIKERQNIGSRKYRVGNGDRATWRWLLSGNRRHNEGEQDE
ncbi:CaiF/GrlA family transcriptional regulator [Salmonella enterica]